MQSTVIIRKYSAACLLAAALFAPVGCGGAVGFKIADQEDPDDPNDRDDVTITQKDKDLAVHNGDGVAIENIVAASNVTDLTGRFLYTPESDIDLVVPRVTLRREKCGNEKSVQPELTWNDITPVAEGETAPEELTLKANDAFHAVKGRQYALGVEVGTSFGQCKYLSVAFKVLVRD